jgi:hypothetical protein
MAPLMEATFTLNKARMREETTTPKAEETLRASSLELRFTRDYIPLRKDDAKPMTLKKDTKYPLVTPDIPYGVIIDEDMLGKVPQLKYVDQNITNITKLPERALRKYLELKIDKMMNQTILVTKVWARGLERTGIMFEILHFDIR